MSSIYTQAFSRDFSLVSQEIWWRGEVSNEKIWTKEHRPFFPYIVFEKTEETVNAFYDPKGIKWIKKLLLDKAKKDRGFLDYLKKNFLESFEAVKSVYEKKSTLSRNELCQYLGIYEKGYVWFEAAWWLWDIDEKDSGGNLIPKSFRQLREITQDYAPKSEVLIRKSLARIYPDIKELIDVIQIFEIRENKIPNVSELLKRKRGYYFTDNKLFTGLSKKDVEKKYGITLETTTSENVGEFSGVVAYKGRVTGKVKIVMSARNLDKVELGDILVSPMTLPDFLPAIKKSSAIVVDEGGLLCHAAIVAREFKKPCIIGTKIATQVLKDGDLVEVDANKGVVRIVERN